MSNARLVARSEENDADGHLFSVDGLLAGRLGQVDQRVARFDAASDVPADITSAANVSADIVAMNTFSSTARRVQIIWHGPGTTFTAVANAGPIAIGARVTINAPDTITAENRLTYADLTGGGTSTAGVPDTLMVSPSNPFVELLLGEEILRIDAVGIYAGVTPTNILASFLEVRVIG